MGNDTPDWGGNYNNAQFYPLDDLAELAARLGSAVTYDRRGAVVWMYDFRHGIGDVGPDTTGTGSLVALNADQYESAPFSCKLQAGTSSPARAWIDRRIAMPLSRRVGYQASYRIASNIQVVYHNIYHYDGVLWWYAYLYLDLVNDKLQVRDRDAGLVTVLDPLPDLIGAAYFAHVKLVVDLDSHVYVRCMLDDNEIDLSDYTIGSVANATPSQIRVRSTAETSAGIAGVCGVDNLIITANEP